MGSAYVIATGLEQRTVRPVATGSEQHSRRDRAKAAMVDEAIPLADAASDDGAAIDMFSEPGLLRAEARLAAHQS